MVGINREVSFQPRRQSAVSKSVSRLISTLHLSRSQDCIAIVGPPERTSAKEFCRPAPNARCRVEVFSDRLASNDEMEQHGARVDFGRLNTLVCSGQISRILLATPANEGERLASVLKHLEGMDVDVDFVLDGIPTYSRIGLGGEDVCFARLLRRPLTSSQALIKSIVDWVGALLLLVLLAPLLLCIALMVKLTGDGPVLFRQKRFGINNEVFDVLKFRTLHDRHTDPNSQRPVTKYDDRVTLGWQVPSSAKSGRTSSASERAERGHVVGRTAASAGWSESPGYALPGISALPRSASSASRDHRTCPGQRLARRNASCGGPEETSIVRLGVCRQLLFAARRKDRDGNMRRIAQTKERVLSHEGAL